MLGPNLAGLGVEIGWIDICRLRSGVPLEDFLQVRRQRIEPLPAELGQSEDGGLTRLGDVFGGIPVPHGREHRDAGDRSVNCVVLQRRQHFAQGHRLRRRTKPLHRNGLKLRREYPNLLALEVGETADRRSRDDRGRCH